MRGTCKLLCLAAAAAFIGAIPGCKNKEEKKTDEIIPVVFTPFKAIMILHPVADFTKWQIAYHANDSVRKVYGVSDYFIGRGLDDSSMVLVVDKVTEGQKAKDFADLPKVKEDMEKAGVTGQPVVSIVNVIREDDSTITQKDRVMVSHRVNDFATWVKVFDEEGKSTRAANGLLDRGMARGLVDSNMVYLQFAITDLEKAKARIASEDLKNLMTKAGVSGPPDVFYYKLVE